MKRNSYLLLVLMMMLAMASCEGQSGAKKLSVNEFEKKLTETPGKIILDVRTPNEYNSGHLPDAMLINVNDKDFKSKIEQLDKSKPVFVYCKAGYRSSNASAILLQSGFKEVYDLQGGIDSWSGAKKTVVR